MFYAINSQHRGIIVWFLKPDMRYTNDLREAGTFDNSCCERLKKENQDLVFIPVDDISEEDVIMAVPEQKLSGRIYQFVSTLATPKAT